MSSKIDFDLKVEFYLKALVALTFWFCIRVFHSVIVPALPVNTEALPGWFLFSFGNYLTVSLITLVLLVVSFLWLLFINVYSLWRIVFIVAVYNTFGLASTSIYANNNYFFYLYTVMGLVFFGAARTKNTEGLRSYLRVLPINASLPFLFAGMYKAKKIFTNCFSEELCPIFDENSLNNIIAMEYFLKGHEKIRYFSELFMSWHINNGVLYLLGFLGQLSLVFFLFFRPQWTWLVGLFVIGFQIFTGFVFDILLPEALLIHVFVFLFFPLNELPPIMNRWYRRLR